MERENLEFVFVGMIGDMVVCVTDDHDLALKKAEIVRDNVFEWPCSRYVHVESVPFLLSEIYNKD